MPTMKIEDNGFKIKIESTKTVDILGGGTKRLVEVLRAGLDVVGVQTISQKIVGKTQVGEPLVLYKMTTTDGRVWKNMIRFAEGTSFHTLDVKDEFSIEIFNTHLNMGLVILQFSELFEVLSLKIERV